VSELRPFDYHEPDTLEEALDLLQAHQDDAHLLAGGTAMVLLMAQGLAQPEHVVGLRRIQALRGIRRRPDGGLELGAMVTHAEAERSPAVAAHCPALRTAFSEVATVRIRNQGTVGGNLVHADPAQDPPPMLLALGAEVVAASPRGQRRIPLHELFVGFFQTSLEPDEIVTAVSLPPPDQRASAAYLKFLPRTQDDYATISVAAWVRPDGEGGCAEARIALGAAGAVPLRAWRAEELLAGGPLDGEAVAAAAAAVREEVDPIDDARGSASYKREMARVWTQRALRAAIAGAPPGERPQGPGNLQGAPR
jgi:carbon-monoxide dehydrogenase medium subunit